MEGGWLKSRCPQVPVVVSRCCAVCLVYLNYRVLVCDEASQGELCCSTESNGSRKVGHRWETREDRVTETSKPSSSRAKTMKPQVLTRRKILFAYKQYDNLEREICEKLQKTESIHNTRYWKNTLDTLEPLTIINVATDCQILCECRVKIDSDQVRISTPHQVLDTRPVNQPSLALQLPDMRRERAACDHHGLRPSSVDSSSET
ncbi:hypothetical protein RRG08_041121 [Elysia crispata]|uniref:Uncharacterized protein n=1 Tax=Elysia crispata TaxID=231223 RepID=A0AAE1CPA1_9GAST|nr:hypothetical protein RRG08_041121 [Elysia crispata]